MGDLLTHLASCVTDSLPEHWVSGELTVTGDSERIDARISCRTRDEESDLLDMNVNLSTEVSLALFTLLDSMKGNTDPWKSLSVRLLRNADDSARVAAEFAY